MHEFDLNMISGLRKSGTTLTKNLMDGHPDLFVIPPSEFDFFCYSRHKTLAQPKYEAITDPNLLLQALANQDFIRRMNASTRMDASMLPAEVSQTVVRSEFDVPKFLALAEQAYVESYREIFIELFKAMAQSCSQHSDAASPIKYIFKNTLETEFFGLYKTWFPKMKLLYVLRNPYAQFAAQTRGEYIEGARFKYPLLAPYINIMRYEYYFINYWKDVYADDIKIIRYEDLVVHTESVMTEVAKFFGVPFNESMLTPTLLGEPWGGNSSAKGEVYNGVNKGPLNRWKKVLTKQEIFIVNKFFEQTLLQYGYEMVSGSRSIWPLHRSESVRRYFGNKYLEYAPYY